MELRVDYFNLYQTIISAGRGKRPNDFIMSQTTEDSNLICPFCPGNENETPLEIGKITDGSSWKIRWVLNKYPPFEEPFGKNIIIVDSNNHKKQLSDFSLNDFVQLLEVYKKIVLDYLSQGYNYPFIFKNFGFQAGASRAHSHSQGAIYKEFPQTIIKLSELSNKNGVCKYCEIIQRERNETREITKNSNIIAFCPNAPKFNNEVWILPLKHFDAWGELSDEFLMDFADVFLKILKVIHKQFWHYNFYFEFGSDNYPLHFNLKIMPRLNTWAAVEIATQNYIISVAPEDSARFYKEQLTLIK